MSIHLSKPTERKAPRVNPNINYGHGMMMTCQCQGSLAKIKCPTLEGVLTVRAAASGWRQGVLDFSLNLKLL